MWVEEHSMHRGQCGWSKVSKGMIGVEIKSIEGWGLGIEGAGLVGL